MKRRPQRDAFVQDRLLQVVPPGGRVTIDDASRARWTHLMIAAHAGNPSVVEQLIESHRGGYINGQTGDGKTALMIAAYCGHTAVVKVLIDKGADFNATDFLGHTPLMHAASRGHVAVVNLLIAKGASFWHETQIGDTALTCAAANGQVGVVERLFAKAIEIGSTLRHSSWSSLVSSAGRALKCAAFEGQVAVVDLLIAKGIEIDNRDEYGLTPLMWAAMSGQAALPDRSGLTTIELLIERQAEIDRTDERGRTALMHAAEQGQVAIVELLLAKGNPNIETRDSDNRTATDIARSQEQENIVSILDHWKYYKTLPSSQPADLRRSPMGEPPTEDIERLAGHLPEGARTSFKQRVSDDFKAAATIAERGAAAGLSATQIAAAIADDTLVDRFVRFQKGLREIELPEGGFTRKEEAQAAAAFAKTFHDLQESEAVFGLLLTDKPPEVSQAEAMKSAYYRHHTETGELIPARPRGRPRRSAQPRAASARS
jgi:ankyrin repeat protein